MAAVPCTLWRSVRHLTSRGLVPVHKVAAATAVGSSKWAPVAAAATGWRWVHSKSVAVAAPPPRDSSSSSSSSSSDSDSSSSSSDGESSSSSDSDGGEYGGRYHARTSTRSAHKTGAELFQSPVWSTAITASLDRINTIVTTELERLRDLHHDSGLWAGSFEALLRIHNSPSKHLLRPQLVLLGAQCLNKAATDDTFETSDGLELFAAGIEMQHLFMLVHDDVMDQATRRRGEPPVHVAVRQVRGRVDVDRLAGHQLAVIVGDVTQAAAMGLLARGASMVGQPGAVDTVLGQSYYAAAAQFDDIVGWRGVRDRLDADDADSVMRGVLLNKGARHTMCAPLLAGMHMAGAGPELHQLGQVWAEHTGVALQAMDDVADLIGNFVTTGKDTFQDFRDRRLSLLVYLLWRRAQGTEDWREMATWWRGDATGVLMPHEKQFLMRIMDKYDVVPGCFEWVHQELDAAEELLVGPGAMTQLPDGSLLRLGLERFVKGLRQHAASLSSEAEADRNSLDNSPSMHT